MPEFMLKKVAICQGFRLCFPAECGALPYSQEEAEFVNMGPVTVLEEKLGDGLTDQEREIAEMTKRAEEKKAAAKTAAQTQDQKKDEPTIDPTPESKAEGMQLIDRVTKMLDAFGQMGYTEMDIAMKAGKPLDKFTDKDYADMETWYKALKVAEHQN